MGRIVIGANASLDGVVQDPDGKEGFKTGGWFYQFIGGDFAAWSTLFTAQAMDAEALLLGRRSEEWFGSRESPNPEWGDRVAILPKYVVSSNGGRPKWTGATAVKGDVVKAIAELKQRVDGNILVYGSYGLIRTLLEHDLADELQVVMFPVVLGSGMRLFEEIGVKSPMHLVEARKVGEGLAFYKYHFVHDREA